MTIWRDGGDYGRLCREITNKTRNRAICKVWTRQFAEHRDTDGHAVEPWPEGEANFALILQAPLLLETLETIEKLAQRIVAALDVPTRTRSDWRTVQRHASAAIAAAKGENDEEDELV